jgi:hypothetical protein
MKAWHREQVQNEALIPKIALAIKINFSGE